MNFGFFCPKMAVSWRTSAFHKNRPWNPYFYSVFLGARFLGQGVKTREILKSHQEKWKNLTDNWKANFLVFLLVFWVLFFLVFFCFATSLGPKPSCLAFVLFFGCFFLGFFWGEGLRVRWGGPKGHLTWPLTLLISFLFFLLFCVLFFLVFFWGGLRVRWGGPKGHLTWP